MQIYINMKTAGSSNPSLAKTLYEIPDSVSTVRELLESLVEIEVELRRRSSVCRRLRRTKADFAKQSGNTVRNNMVSKIRMRFGKS